jgi:hypothetical protein
MLNKKIKNQGSVLIFIIIIAAIGATVLLGLIVFVASQDRNSRTVSAQEQSFGVAEEGIYWYRWYLAHKIEGKTAREVDEFWTTGDPIGVVEPYEVEVKDPSGAPIGKYQLEITPPPTGSSIIIAKSTGWTYKYPKVKGSFKFASESRLGVNMSFSATVTFVSGSELKCMA